VGTTIPPPSSSTTWSRSEAYRTWFARPLGQAYRRSVEDALRPWIPAAAPRLALDAGCGPILTFLDVFDRASSIVAVDCSFEMARSARARLAASERRGATLCASIEHLPFGDARFDFALSINCLEFVPDPARALAELRRVTASGARAVVGVLNRDGPWEWTRRWQRLSKDEPYYRGRFFTAGGLVADLGAAGWTVEELRAAVHFPPVPLLRARWYHWLEGLVPDARAGMILVRAVRSA
jgi:SAM-dependent methyltransferase